jgi:hypothetical protein
VADELVAEFTDPNNNIEAPDPDNPNAVRNVASTWHEFIYLIWNVLGPYCMLTCSNNMMKKIFDEEFMML